MMREIDNTYISLFHHLKRLHFATSTVQVKNKNNQSNRISFHTAYYYYLTIRFLCLLFNASNNNMCIACPLPLLTYVSDVSYSTAMFFIFHHFSPISAQTFLHVVPTYLTIHFFLLLLINTSNNTCIACPLHSCYHAFVFMYISFVISLISSILFRRPAV